MSEITWSGFSDPYEGAFSTQVPSGWKVVGGLLRHTATDPSIFLRALSPDERTYLFIGDPAVTNFTTPRQSIFGVTEPESGTVKKYLPALAFAREYVEQTVARMCARVVITGQQDRPDLARGPWTSINPQAHHDGAEATFTCDWGAQPARGIVAAATYIYWMPGNLGGMLWSIDFLAGCIAPPDGYDDALALLKQIIAATRLNPVWQQRQLALTNQVAHAIDANTQQILQRGRQHLNQAMQINAQIADIQRHHAAAREHQADQMFASWDRIVSGYSPYADAAGNVRDLDNTQPYHWIGPDGTTAATNTPNSPPGGGWQPLREVPPN